MKPIVVLAVVVGIVLIGVAVYYFITPANQLMSFMPGHDASVTSPHLKHAIASGLLGIACFVLAWFVSGSKSQPAE